MNCRRTQYAFTAFTLLSVFWYSPFRLCAADVTAHIRIEQSDKQEKRESKTAGLTNVVLWLDPLTQTAVAPRPAPEHYRLIQHNKEFSPHLLVIPLGSSVDFPNRDPFYHNVFSLFNGKRFDLGLYESGSNRTVRFDHEGVSYIFCNIHPEMGAVVIALRTPYFAVASADGDVTIHDVPLGSYQLTVWAEGGDSGELKGLARPVQVTTAQVDLGVIPIHAVGQQMKHKNKFGEDYGPADVAPY